MTDATLSDREIFNIKYMINRRMLKSDDELDEMVCDLLDHQDAQITAQAARIAALEAELAAVRNPPYEVVMNYYGDGDDEPWQGVVKRGDVELFISDWSASQSEARAEAQAFIDKLAK